MARPASGNGRRSAPPGGNPRRCGRSCQRRASSPGLGPHGEAASTETTSASPGRRARVPLGDQRPRIQRSECSVRVGVSAALDSVDPAGMLGYRAEARQLDHGQARAHARLRRLRSDPCAPDRCRPPGRRRARRARAGAEEMFYRMARRRDFDVAEFSLATYTVLRGRGEPWSRSRSSRPSRSGTPRSSCAATRASGSRATSCGKRVRRAQVPHDAQRCGCAASSRTSTGCRPATSSGSKVARARQSRRWT